MNISSTRAHPFTWLRSRMLGNIKPIGPIGHGFLGFEIHESDLTTLDR